MGPEGEPAMENSLLVGLSRQVALRRELDVIANNLANLGTTGFKGEGVLFQEFLDGQVRDHGFAAPDQRVAFVIDRATRTDFSQGPMERTGNALDVAIDGEGFLVVETDDGERFTRNGTLTVDSTGRLVTASGQAVLGDGGPIVLEPDDTEISIAPDGTVSTRDGDRGRLRVVRFENEAQLVKGGENLFAANDAPLPAEPRTRILQGMIEKSNVRPVVEMSRMIEVTRAYTTLANMMQRTDELRRNAIERLAEVPA
jgi:flagellar basal-body rod protein FlgF